MLNLQTRPLLFFQEEALKKEEAEDGEKPLKYLPLKSREKYEQQYNMFLLWCNENNISSTSEQTLLQYFLEKSKSQKSSSLWSSYSMLKTTILVKDHIDISGYTTLLSFIKSQSVGYKPKKSKTLTEQEIIQFLQEAPDIVYLLKKVILIFGVAGGCRRDELTYLNVEDVEEKDSMLVVTVHNSEGEETRVFTISNDGQNIVDYVGICKKYMDTRPDNSPTPRLFLRYSKGRCVKQPVGMNTIGKIPQEIAQYLDLPDPAEYTGHCFRRTSDTLWKKKSRKRGWRNRMYFP